METLIFVGSKRIIEKKLSISLEAGGSPAQVRYCESQIQGMFGEGGQSAATGSVYGSSQSALQYIYPLSLGQRIFLSDKSDL